MNLDFDQITLTIDKHEATLLYRALRNDVKTSLDAMGGNVPDRWEANCRHVLDMLRQLSRITGQDFAETLQEFRCRARKQPAEMTLGGV